MMAEENGLGGDARIHEATSSSPVNDDGRHLGANENEEKHEKSKEHENTKSVPFFKLFSFADSTDYLLMFLGAIGAIANGMSMPLMTLLLGDVINAFGNNQLSKDMTDLVSKV